MSEFRESSGQTPARAPVAGTNAICRFRFGAAAALVIAFAAVLRLAFIGRFEVWLDEAYCFAVAKKPLSLIFADLAFDNGPPLYYIMLHYWMKVFGEGPAAIRSLSAVFSTGAVAVVVFWNTPWFSKTARLLAGFTLAITPLAIYYGQEARMYSPVVFFVLVSMVFLERGLRLGGFLNWALMALSTALGLYTSYVAIFLVPTGYIVTAIEYVATVHPEGLGKRFWNLFFAHVAAALLFSPWLPVFLRQPSAEAVQWIGPIWEKYDKTLLPLQSASLMTTGGAYYPRYLRNLYQGPERTSMVREATKEGREKSFSLKIAGSVPSWLALSVMGLLSLFVLAAALRRQEPFPYRALLVAWVLLSFMVPIVMSYFRPMFVLGRYELTGVPAAAVLFGIGFSRQKRVPRAVCIAAAVLLFAYSWAYMYSWSETRGLGKKAGILRAAASPGDVVLCEAFEYAQAYYHVGPARDSVTWLTCPLDTIKHAAWIDYDRWLWPGWEMPRDAMYQAAAAALAEAIEKAPPGKAVIIVRPVGVGGWMAAMDGALRTPLVKAVDAGGVVADMEASKPQDGIVVLRRPQ